MRRFLILGVKADESTRTLLDANAPIADHVKAFAELKHHGQLPEGFVRVELWEADPPCNVAYPHPPPRKAPAPPPPPEPEPEPEPKKKAKK